MKAGTRLPRLALHLWARPRSFMDSLGHCLVSTVCPVVRHQMRALSSWSTLALDGETAP